MTDWLEYGLVCFGVQTSEYVLICFGVQTPEYVLMCFGVQTAIMCTAAALVKQKLARQGSIPIGDPKGGSQATFAYARQLNDYARFTCPSLFFFCRDCRCIDLMFAKSCLFPRADWRI
jgi:hypothetical protein